MFSQLLRRLSAPAPPANRPESPLALAALLVRLARADGVYTSDEAAQVDRLLAAQFSLSPFAATALRA